VDVEVAALPLEQEVAGLALLQAVGEGVTDGVADAGLEVGRLLMASTQRPHFLPSR
jgi:hypothetical protein